MNEKAHGSIPATLGKTFPSEQSSLAKTRFRAFVYIYKFEYPSPLLPPLALASPSPRPRPRLALAPHSSLLPPLQLAPPSSPLPCALALSACVFVFNLQMQIYKCKRKYDCSNACVPG